MMNPRSKPFRFETSVNVTSKAPPGPIARRMIVRADTKQLGDLARLAEKRWARSGGGAG